MNIVNILIEDQDRLGILELEHFGGEQTNYGVPWVHLGTGWGRRMLETGADSPRGRKSWEGSKYRRRFFRTSFWNPIKAAFLLLTVPTELSSPRTQN